MTNKNTVSVHSYSSMRFGNVNDRGFTLSELIVGIAVAGVVISSTVALTTGIQRSTTNANNSISEINKTDNILNQIKQLKDKHFVLGQNNQMVKRIILRVPKIELLIK